MTACDLERRTDGHPVCFTHKRSVQECLAAKDSEIAELRTLRAHHSIVAAKDAELAELRKRVSESEGRYHAILLTLESRDMSLWDMEQERDAAQEQVKELSVAKDLLEKLRAEIPAGRKPSWMSAAVCSALNDWPEYLP